MMTETDITVSVMMESDFKTITTSTSTSTKRVSAGVPADVLFLSNVTMGV
jgi:hypothetical protein